MGLADMPMSALPRSVSIARRRAFTLIELMVVMVLIAILASLTLAGLSGVRQSAKEDKTRSTIRKIDSVIQPMYESYATRRVPLLPPLPAVHSPQQAAAVRLRNLRMMMAMEMPDTWADVSSSSSPLPIPLWAQNAAFRRYVAYKDSHPSLTPLYGEAETLYMILSAGNFDPDAMEQFRGDEIGDIDNDGTKEFWDGWGRPILFVRWPAAFVSPGSPATQPDPLDVMRVTGPPPDRALMPLLLSAGPDESTNDPLSGVSGYGITVGASWLDKDPISITSTCVDNKMGAVDPKNPNAVTDNITNYDLLTK